MSTSVKRVVEKGKAEAANREHVKQEAARPRSRSLWQRFSRYIQMDKNDRKRLRAAAEAFKAR